MNLTAVAGGLTRQRIKGAARRDTLYDLLNGYVTSEGTIQVRPGTVRHATLPAGTVGLTAFAGALHVFSHASIEEIPTGFVLHVLIHPDAVAGASNPDHELAQIHFAEPFMGFLYVAAEFGNGDVYHYWLQTSGTWQADHVYRAGDMVSPTVPDGLAYRALRMGAANGVWAALVPRTVGEKVEPTTYNGYYYEVVDTIGAAAASGTVEPVWPVIEGAQVMEDGDGVIAPPPYTGPEIDLPIVVPKYVYTL